jgi:hypothetical protein
MVIKFNKNIQFTRLVKADGRLKEFNFRRVNGLHDSVFTVDVSDDRGYRIMFKMTQIEGRWKLVDQPLPSWIIENEANFNDLIEEELRLSQ